MNTLTDRYVWAAARSVPETQRAEFANELRERIGDESDALIESGHSPADAEVAALTELGDPAKLAASYVDRPLQLIGPRYFLTWWRLLKVLLIVVLPITTAAVVLAQLLAAAPIADIIGSAISTAFGLAVHLGFWTTLVFALVERSPGSDPITKWTPQLLPQLPNPARSHRLGELIASVVFLGVFAGAIVWQQFFSVFTDASGGPIPLLNPELWSFWLPYFLVFIALEALFAVAVYVSGWNWWLAAGNLVLNVAFVVPALWLFTSGLLFNPAYLAETGWPWGEAGGIVVTIVVTVVVVSATWDVVDGVIKTVRARPAARVASA